MARRLKLKDVEELLKQYRSQRKVLTYQLDLVRGELKKLRAYRDSIEAGEAPAPLHGSRKKSSSKRARKRGRKKKRTVVGGYKLSNWDQMVIDTIKKNDRLMTKAELLTEAKVWAKKNESRMKVAEVELKLTRVLQKLSGKRGDLGKYRSGLMRGLHYGVGDWFFAANGKLKQVNLKKLKLPKD